MLLSNGTANHPAALSWACLQRFAEEMRAAEAELQAEEQRAKHAEAELEEAQAELAALREQAGQLEDLEQRYWHSANQLTSSLRWHADQRTSLQRKVLLGGPRHFVSLDFPPATLHTCYWTMHPVL